ncbi:serine/threonine-protein kinase 17A-like isoform X1 [Dermochelys coriacea]|uniref:serine/threonine-protein kinase 17A-like isoform X1 n=1 Tax=Dermochelys coriacea TaxID=27794 RepID=UPI0018E751C3|nr:serine/threonine-protein kinase 17A-like isoform X1 [Dermochelys coriacea]
MLLRAPEFLSGGMSVKPPFLPLALSFLWHARPGKFAVVKKCQEKATGREFAAKFLRKRRRGEDCRLDIINEIAVLELAARSPHVVDLHEVYETPTEIVLVLECAAGGEIFQQCVAEQDEAFTEWDVIRLVRQILRGVAYLHQNNVVHLDLKPQNILLTSSSPLGDIRIVDFGLSRRVDAMPEVREILGTVEYMAPEVLSYEPISTATDMWSVGVLTYIMLTGESPFLGDTKQETFLNISQVNVQFPPDVFQGISAQAIDFIRSLLIKNPRKRAKAEQCLQHPWLAPAPASLMRTEMEQALASEGSSGPEEDKELVLVASYTMPCPCRQLGGLEGRETELAGARKPFPALQEIAQELLC